jgi:pilus assembly protein CpaE
VIEAEPGEAVADRPIKSASLAVIEVDPKDSRSIDRLVQLHRAKPATPLVAPIPDASVTLVRTLVREGVADVISLPFAADELLDAALDVLASASLARSAGQRLAPMIAVTRSIGGCGATSIATHLGAELARQGAARGNAAIVDLDLQFGSIADVLGAQGKGSITDLLEAGDRLDDELIASVARHSEDGLAVIAAPGEILPLEAVDTDKLLHVLEQLRRNYSHVVLDLPANWTNWTLSATAAANVIVMVVELSIQSLRHAKRRLELFHSVGIGRNRIAIVVNRVEKRLFRTISLDDVARTLHHPVLASIALDEPTVGSAQDQGRLVTALHRKSRFGGDMSRMAEALLAQLGDRH